MQFSDRFLELGTLGAYLAVLVWIGFRAARQVRSAVDYTLAGRNIPWIVVLATTAATMIGGGASVGMVSRVYEVGIAAALITCGWHLQLIFTGLWVAPKLRGLNLVTVGDYFELKFGSLARELAMVNCVIFLVGALVAQMAAIGTVTHAVLGVRYDVALFIGAAVTVCYSTVGGIRAVIKTDVLQLVILVTGIGAAAAILMVNNGGFEGMLAKAGAQSFEVTGSWSRTRVVSLFFAFLLGETFVPPYAVRCFIARDSQQAKWGVAGAGLFLLLFLPIATFIIGLSAQLDPDVKQAVLDEKNRILHVAAVAGVELSEDEAARQAHQLAFPTLVRVTFHPAVSGIIIAAIIAAVMSTADSCLSCLSTVVMEDNYRRHVNRHATDRQLLRVAKVTTFLAGVGAAALALFFSNVADILEFVYDFWAPSMVVPFCVGVFWYRQTRVYAVVVSMLSGLTASVIWRFALGSPGDLSPALAGFGVAVVALFVSLPLTRRLPLGKLFQPASLPQLEAKESS